MSDPGHQPSRAFGNQPPPFPPPRPVRRRPWLASILTVGVVLALVVAAAVTGRPNDGRDFVVTRYLPPSGGRVVLGDATATDEVQEWAVLGGLAPLAGGPAAFIHAGPDLDAITETLWARMSSVTADAAGRVSARSTHLLAVGTQGLDLRVTSGPEGFTTYTPGLRLLGGDSDESWTTTGTVRRGTTGLTVTSTLPYHAQIANRRIGNGCVAVAVRLTIAREPVVETDQTWCPGRGITASRRDGVSRVAADRPPRWVGALRPTDPPPAVLDGAWSFERRRMLRSVRYSVRPAVLANGLIAYPSEASRDVIARAADGEDSADPRWVAHPGGTVTSMLSAGSVLVVTTTERRVVGYGADGQYLWQAQLSDVSAVPITRVGGLAVVAALDGSVTAFDIATGATAWTGSTPNEIRLPPVADRDGVTVLDQAGNLAVFAGDGTVRHTLHVEAPESFTVLGGLAVVASRQDRFVRGYRLTDGGLAWRRPVPGGRWSMTSAGDRVIIRQSDQVLTMAADDGRALWTAPLRVTDLLVVGDRVVFSDRTSITLYDLAGTELASQPTQEPDLSASPGAMLTTADGSLAMFFGDFVYRKERR